MKRAFDLTLSLLLLLALAPLLLCIALAIRYDTPGPALHWSRRVGRHNEIFLMPKFRTMRLDTPQLATHLLHEPQRWVTPLGRFLRRSSLDELPQLWSVLRGQMSMVGPRPALFNQDDLINARTALAVQSLRPGITGWAQINGRDDLPIPVKVAFDAEYLAKCRQGHGLAMDLKILALTFWRVWRSHGVQH